MKFKISTRTASLPLRLNSLVQSKVAKIAVYEAIRAKLRNGHKDLNFDVTVWEGVLYEL